MIHPDTRVVPISDDIGLGLVATTTIPRGTITWVRDPLDRVVSPTSYRRLIVTHPALDRSSYRRHDGDYILLWDDARFMNHSCEPNCALTDFDAEIAIQDILPGEQLTNDYAMLFLGEDEPFLCRCGFASCRAIVRAADVGRLRPVWDAEITEAIELVAQTRQPLGPHLRVDQLARKITPPPVPDEVPVGWLLDPAVGSAKVPAGRLARTAQ
jgi:uncharacterized protein